MIQQGECWIPEYRECCCTCRFHLQDFHHCTTDWAMRQELDKCICSIPKGWVCAPPEFTGVHSGWSEHGLCEMWQPKKTQEPNK